MAIEGVPDLFFSETVVAWAAGSTSALVGDFVRCVAEGAGAQEQPPIPLSRG